MSDTGLLIKEIEAIPADYTARILDFIEFLKDTPPQALIQAGKTLILLCKQHPYTRGTIRDSSRTGAVSCGKRVITHPFPRWH
jgi:hypothetical protein